MSAKSSHTADDQLSLPTTPRDAAGMSAEIPYRCEISGAAADLSHDVTVSSREMSRQQVGSVIGPYQTLALHLNDAFGTGDVADVTQLLGTRRVFDQYFGTRSQHVYPSIDAWMRELHTAGESLTITEGGRARDMLMLGSRVGDSRHSQPIAIAVDMTGDCSMTVHNYYSNELSRTNHLADWTDAGLLIFGGYWYDVHALDGTAEFVKSGTVLHIAPESRRLLGSDRVEIAGIPWPIDIGENGLPELHTLWADQRLMVVASIETDIFVLTYDLAANRWERSHALPGRPGAIGEVVWTGGELLMVGGSPFKPSQQAWSYEPNSGRWERRDDLPIGPVEGLHGTQGDGIVYFAGAEQEVISSQPNIAAYELAAKKWTVIPVPVSSQSLLPSRRLNSDSPHADLKSSSPLTGRDEFRQLLWTGSELVYFYAELGEHAAATLATPCRDRPDPYAVSVLKDSEDASPSVLLFYNPEQDSWRTSAPMPSDHPINQTLVWTGTHIVLWGGVSSEAYLGCPGHVSAQHGYVYDVAADQWQRTSPSPLGPRCGHSVTSTGSHIIVFGGTPSCDIAGPALSDGAIYDLSKDSWASFRLENSIEDDG